MQRLFFIFTISVLLFSLASSAFAESSVIIRGKWGKEIDQLGIVFPDSGIMPTAPYMCIGGYDVDEKGRFWFSDSVNRMLKCFDRKKWSYIMMNAEKLGDIICHNNMLYVITRNPDGVTIVDPEKGKTLETIRFPFANPGRLQIFNDTIIAVEEPGKGLWLKMEDKVFIHPAAALEAVTNGKRIFGVQYSFEPESRGIISAELAKELQEPDILTVFDAGEEILFSKLAGTIADSPVLGIIVKSRPETLSFIRFDKNMKRKKLADLPILQGPYLPGIPWKLCSDKNFYGFYGTEKDGFRIYKANQTR